MRYAGEAQSPASIVAIFRATSAESSSCCAARSARSIPSAAASSEIASAYARLGVSVQLFEALPRVLPTEDADVSKVAERALKKQGIEIHTGARVENVQSRDDGVSFTYGDQPGDVDGGGVPAGRKADPPRPIPQ